MQDSSRIIKVSGYLSSHEAIIACLKIFLLLITGAVFVYLFNFPFSNTIFFSAIFIAFLRSKDNIFWVAFLLILMCNPWGLFYYRTYNWMIPVTPTISIPYMSMYGFVFLLKARSVFGSANLHIPDFLKRFYKIFAVYTLFLIILSMIFGHSLASLFKIVIFLPSLLTFIYLPRFAGYRELIGLNKIVFFFIIIHSAGVFFDIVSNGLFIKSITFGKPLTGAIFTDEIVRILGGIGLNLYVMVTGLFYIIRNETAFNKWYLWLVVLLAYLTILVSATRGWMIASTFLLGTALLFSVMRSTANIRSGFAFVVVFMAVILLLPGNVRTNLESAFARFLTIEAMAEGDLTAGGTVIRLTERGPRALTRFNESPVFGFGYSSVTEEYYDGHVGNHSLLIQGGITGLIIVYATIFALIVYMFRLDFRRKCKGLFVFGLALISVMIIHSSSRAMVTFYLPPDSAMLLALFFSHVNALLLEVVNSNKPQL